MGMMHAPFMEGEGGGGGCVCVEGADACAIRGGCGGGCVCVEGADACTITGGAGEGGWCVCVDTCAIQGRLGVVGCGWVEDGVRVWWAPLLWEP